MTTHDPMSNISFYGALGDYERTVRERKFRIAESEDKIANLKATLQDTRAQNQKLESKCEILKLESGMAEVRYESENYKKSRLEAQKMLQFQEYEELRTAIRRKEALLESIENFKTARLALLKKTEQDFMEQYKKIPSILEYIHLSEDIKQLETSYQEKQTKIQENVTHVEKLNLQSQHNWVNFVNLCIRIALQRDILRTKVKEFKALFKRFQNEHEISSNYMDSVGILDKNISNSNLSLVSEFSEDHKSLNSQTLPLQNPVGGKSGVLGSRSLLEQKLQQFRNKNQSWSSNDSSTELSTSGGLGIKRYYNAVEKLKSKGALSCGKVVNSENDLQKSINEIHKRYARNSLPVSKSKGDSVFKQQIQGYKATYSSWLTEMVESQRFGNKPSEAKKSKSTPSELGEKSELVKDIEEMSKNLQVDNVDQSENSVMMCVTNYSQEVQPSKKPSNPIDKPDTISVTPSKKLTNGPTNKVELLKSKLVGPEDAGLFKVPPPPKPHSTPNSKPKQDKPFESNFFTDNNNTGNEFSMDTTTLDIFGDMSRPCEDISDSPTSSTTHGLFDFEKFFRPGKDSPLF